MPSYYTLLIILPGEYLETILVGNKIDLPLHERQVSTVEGEGLAAELGVPFVETSALNGSNVENAFVRMTQVYSSFDSYSLCNVDAEYYSKKNVFRIF